MLAAALPASQHSKAQCEISTTGTDLNKKTTQDLYLLGCALLRQQRNKVISL
jgi:hypothetical protein